MRHLTGQGEAGPNMGIVSVARKTVWTSHVGRLLKSIIRHCLAKIRANLHPNSFKAKILKQFLCLIMITLGATQGLWVPMFMVRAFAPFTGKYSVCELVVFS